MEGEYKIRIGDALIATLTDRWACDDKRIEARLNKLFPWSQHKPWLPSILEQAAEHYGAEILTPIPPLPEGTVY